MNSSTGSKWTARCGFIQGILKSAQHGIDLRWLVLGSVLPDIIDKPLGILLFNSFFKSGRIVAHTLLFPLILLVAGLLMRSRARVALLMLAIGSLGHLLLDQMWFQPKTLLWPAMGWDFEPLDIGSLLPHLLYGLRSNPALYVPEAAGAAIAIAFIAYLVVTRRVRRGVLSDIITGV